MPDYVHLSDQNSNVRRMMRTLSVRIKKPVVSLAIILVAAACGLSVAISPAIAQDTKAPEGAVKAQHGDWQVVCKAPPPGSKKEVCALVQSVTAEDRNNVGLTVIFRSSLTELGCCVCLRRSESCCLLDWD